MILSLPCDEKKEETCTTVTSEVEGGSTVVERGSGAVERGSDVIGRSEVEKRLRSNCFFFFWINIFVSRARLVRTERRTDTIPKDPDASFVSKSNEKMWDDQIKINKSSNNRKYYIISYHIISYHILSYHITSYHIISYDMI